MYRIAGFAVTIAAAGVLAISPALAQQAQQPQQQPGGTQGQQARQMRLTSGERQELKNAATAFMAQLEYSRLAQQKAQSEDVKQLANQIVDRHTRLLSEFREFASRHQVDLPTQISSKERKEFERLSNLSGSEFDKAYLQDVEKLQNERIMAWQNISRRTSNEDLRQFASTIVLPRLEEQQTMVHQQMATLGIAPSAPMTDEQQQQQQKSKSKQRTY